MYTEYILNGVFIWSCGRDKMDTPSILNAMGSKLTVDKNFCISGLLRVTHNSTKPAQMKSTETHT